MRRLLGVVGVLVGGGLLACNADLRLPPGAAVQCSSDAQCPATHRCASGSQRCVPREQQDFTAPRLVSATFVGLDGITAFVRAGASVEVVVSFDEDVVSGRLLFPDYASDDPAAQVSLTGAPSGADVAFQYTATGAEAEREHRLTVRAEDRVGNVVEIPLNLELVFDFQAPAVVATPAPRVTIEALSTARRRDVSAASPDATTLLSLTTDEACTPTLVTEPALGLAFELLQDGATSFTFALDWSEVSSSVEQALDVVATLVDRAGNESVVTLPVQLWADNVPPDAPDVESSGAVVFERAPWGTSTSNGQPRMTLRGATGAAEAESLVIAYADSQATLELGRGLVASDGSFGGAEAELFLGASDRRDVFVLTVDRAGNESASARVRDGRWHAVMSSGGASALSPHRLLAYPAFDWVRDAKSATVDTSAASTMDGVSVSTVGAGRWEQVPRTNGFVGRFNAGVAFDYASGTGALFGGTTAASSEYCGLPRADSFETGRRLAWSATQPGEGALLPSLSSPTLTHDHAREVLVLIGKRAGHTGMRVWEQRDGVWQAACATSPCADDVPPAREDYAVTYDPVRRVVVLFGGSAPAAQNDVWEWDGARWRRGCPVGGCAPAPTARYGAIMTFDEHTGEALLFGGSTGGSETWTWNGTRWLARCTEAPCNASVPPARLYHAMAFDPRRDAVVLAGGRTLAFDCDFGQFGTSFTDTWEWDGATWSNVLASGGPGVVQGKLVGHPAYGAVLVGGRSACDCYGYIGNDDQWMWTWDGAAWRALDSYRGGLPSGSVTHGMGYDGEKQRVIMYGGGLGSSPWAWDGHGWSARGGGAGTVTGPILARSAASGAVRLVGGYVSGASVTTSRLYGASTWSSFTAITGARTFAAYTFSGAALVVFGGDVTSPSSEPHTNLLSDTQTYSGSWTARCTGCSEGTSKPARRSFAGLARTGNANDVVLFGGSAGMDDPLGDTWVFNGTGWSKQEPTQSPPARGAAVLAHDASRAAATLFGGAVIFGANKGEGITPPSAFAEGLSDVWEWRGGDWHLANVADPERDGGPSMRYAASMVADELRGELVMYGGTSDAEPWGDLTIIGMPEQNDALSETWVWVGGGAGRPAHVFVTELATSGVTRAELTGVTARFIGDADSDDLDSGAPTTARELLVWDHLGWRSAALDDGETVELALTPAQADRLLQGERDTLYVAAAPGGTNGAGDYARIDTDFAEVVFSYRLEVDTP